LTSPCHIVFSGTVNQVQLRKLNISLWQDGGVCGFEIHDGYDVKSSTAPKQAEAYDQLFAFFERCELFNDGERPKA
jgi:hypothetical protein